MRIKAETISEVITVESTSINKAISNFKYWRIPFNVIYNSSPFKWTGWLNHISSIGDRAEFDMTIGTYGPNPANTINEYVQRMTTFLITMLRENEIMGVDKRRVDSARGILEKWLKLVGAKLIVNTDEFFTGYTMRMVLHDRNGDIYSYNDYIPGGPCDIQGT